MKTIKQIASEIGVSKQAIFYRIKRPPLSNTLKTLISNTNGVLMVSLDGECLIKQAFSNEITKDYIKESAKKPSNASGSLSSYLDDESLEKQPPHKVTVKDASKANENFDGDVMRLLQDNIKVLQSQLEIKDRQIEELTTTVRVQAESINADRKNELAETLIDGQERLIDKNMSKTRKKWQFWKKRD